MHTNYVEVGEKYMIKLTDYMALINKKFIMEKNGLDTSNFNKGQLEIIDSDIEESDKDSDINDSDLEDSDE